MKRLLLIFILLVNGLWASYMLFDDTGTCYLTVGDDGQTIYLWNTNGTKAAESFPFLLPEKARLSLAPFFADVGEDGILDIVCTYTLDNKLYKQVIRQTGDNFDDKVYPQEIGDNTEAISVTMTPVIDERLVALDGKALYNTKYRWYQGPYRHSLYDVQGPTALAIADIYSKVPTVSISLNSTAADLDRYLVFTRQNEQTRFVLYARIDQPTADLLVSINYPEGVYPWRFLSLDWVNNITQQDINYYYDHTSPAFVPIEPFAVYFSPNADGVQDTLLIPVVPSDNLYYKQSAMLDIFDGPTYVVSTRTEGLTFATLNVVWNGLGSDGKKVKDTTYNAQLYVVDGCSNQSRIVTGTIIVDTVAPQIWEHLQNSDYFTPNGDGELDTLQVTLNFSETAFVTMNIYNSFGRLVKTITQNYWDGTDNDGIVESGTYKFNYVITDRAGNKTTSSWYSVYLDYRSPLIENVGPEKEAFNFKKEQFRLNLDLRETAFAKCFVYDRTGNKVATINPGTTVSTGNAVFEWNGSSLADGAYMYRLLVTNRLGITGAVTGVFFNDTTSPLAAFPGLKSGYGPGYITFNITLSEPATATLLVATVTFVPTLSSQLGLTLSAGIYGLTLNALDRAGNTCLITRSIVVGTATTMSESIVPTYTAVEAELGVAVRTLHKPEPQYFNTDRAVRYVVNADEFIKGLSSMSLMPKNIGQFSAYVYDVSRNTLATLTENVAIPAGAQVLTWNATGVTPGIYTLEAKLARGAGISTCSATVVYDTVSPLIIDLRVLNGQGFYTTSRRIDLYLAATDNLLPVTEMQFSVDGLTWGVPEAFANAKYGFLTVTADGIQEVWVKVKDAAGNWSNPASLNVCIDATPPRHKTIRVNGEDGGGAATINVELQFIAEDAHGVSKVKISYNDAYSFVEYPYGTTLSYVLDPTAGLKHFYIKYTDMLGNESGIIHDTVSLDRDPPTQITLNRLTAYWTNTTNVQLQLSAVDVFMGVSQIELSNDGFNNIVTLNYTPVTTLNVTVNWLIPAIETTHNISARFYDAAGNLSNRITASCVYDITPPQILTRNINFEAVYLPTLRAPLQIAVTGNEPVGLSLNITRAGQTIYAKSTTGSVFNWTGENNAGHYLRYGSVCNVAYQITDLAGNVGEVGSLVITLNCGYEVASANYDLSLPSVEAALGTATIEYEDDAAYSIPFPYPGSTDSEARKGTWYAYGNFSIIFPKMSVYYAMTVEPNGTSNGNRHAHCDAAYFRKKIAENNYEYYVGSAQYYARWETWEGEFEKKNVFVKTIFTAGNYEHYLKMTSGGSYASYGSVSVFRKNSARKTIDFKTKNVLTSLNILERVVKPYSLLNPTEQHAGKIANDYIVTVSASTQQVLLFRNGVVSAVQSAGNASGVVVAEPAMYISKQSQIISGNISSADNLGYENVHLVWQQKNSAADKWRVYYAIIPFYYEDLPDAQLSEISAQGLKLLATPGVFFVNPINGDYTGTTPKLEVSVFDDDGVSVSALTLRLNNTATTYNLSSYYTAFDTTQGTINVTLGSTGLPSLKEGKNTLYVQATDLLGNTKEANVTVIVRSGLFIEKLLNYPNPFEDETTITYMLTAEAKEVKARVYDIMGRLRRELYNLPTELGYNEHAWDGKDNNGRELANDVYYLVLLARDDDGVWKKARTKAVKLK